MVLFHREVYVIQGSKSEGKRELRQRKGKSKYKMTLSAAGYHVSGKHSRLLGHVGHLKKDHSDLAHFFLSPDFTNGQKPS